MRLYTLGTGRRPSYDFTRILYKFGIQVLFDIRSQPTVTAENLAHFSRAGLERLCAGNKIDYIYLGNELGAPHPSFRNRQRFSLTPEIQEWLRSPEFSRGIKIIASKLPTRVSCILCSCYFPEHCPRLLIGNELARQEVEVVHLLEENRSWSPPNRRFGPQKPNNHRRFSR